MEYNKGNEVAPMRGLFKAEVDTFVEGKNDAVGPMLGLFQAAVGAVVEGSTYSTTRMMQ